MALPPGWCYLSLGECANWLSGGTPSKSRIDYWDGELPWISAKSLRDFYIRDSEDRVTQLGAENGTKVVPAGTTLFLVRGMSLKTEFRIGIATVPVAFNQDVKALVPQDDIHPWFLAYAVRAQSSRILQMVEVAGHGTGKLVTDRLSALAIPIPPSSEQETIAAVLSSLDDKIELNRQMNRTLEAMAQAIFRSWFVDFDPVVAKADGREPFGLDAETAAMFPDRFVDSELGSIPEGWKVGPVGDLFDLTAGQSPPGSTYNEVGEGIPFYQGRRDFGERFPYRRVYCTEPKRFAEEGDTLVSVRAPVGDANQARERCSIGRGVAAVRSKIGATSFAFYSMLSLAPEFAVFEGAGSVFGSISQRDFKAIEVVAPGPMFIKRFQELAGPMDDLLLANSDESQTLAELRDILLPKLLSGEIRVPEAEGIVEDIA